MGQVEGFEAWIEDINRKFTARKQFNDFLAHLNGVEQSDDALKQIYNIIDNIILGTESEQFVKNLEKGSLYYRARIIRQEDYENIDTGVGINEDDKLCGYNEDNSREPIIGLSREGRVNIAGASYLYMASNKETACAEVKPQIGDLISIAAFELSKEMKIFDFSSEKSFESKYRQTYEMSLGVFFTQLMMQFYSCIW